MRPDPRPLLFDIVSAAESIAEFCRDRTQEDYENTQMLRSACERQFEITGEAMARLRKLHPGVFDRIDRGHDIIAFRNRLIHGYDAVDSAIVWDVIQSRLPSLAQTARELLDEFP